MALHIKLTEVCSKDKQRFNTHYDLDHTLHIHRCLWVPGPAEITVKVCQGPLHFKMHISLFL